MGLIREPLDVDFVVESRSLTKEEEKAISEFIQADKKQRQQIEGDKTKVVKSKTKQLVLQKA